MWCRAFLFGLAAFAAVGRAPAACAGNPSLADVAAAEKGMSWEQGHSAQWHLEQHRRLSKALDALKPQRPGTVDAYVIVAGLDADPVFQREAAETAKVLARRYDAEGRTVLLASGSAAAPDGSPSNLAASLAAIAAKMDKAEDVLVFYATAHGAPGIGVVYQDSDKAYGMMAPARLSGILAELGIARRMVIISACYSGQFVGSLSSPESVVLTAAHTDRVSFGCAAANDWTYFGDALINNALRKPQPLDKAAVETITLVNQWEVLKGLPASEPQIFVGDKARPWLQALEARMPKIASAPVGRPSVETSSLPAAK